MRRTGMSEETIQRRRGFFGTAAIAVAATQLGMIGCGKAGGKMARVFRLLTAAVGMLAIVSVSADSAEDLTPPVGYRHWFHVNTMIVDKASPLFKDLGGMHTVHVNSLGEPAVRKPCS